MDFHLCVYVVNLSICVSLNERVFESMGTIDESSQRVCFSSLVTMDVSMLFEHGGEGHG